MHTEDLPVPQQVWEEPASSSRSVSEGSLNASSEQLALSGFAFQLTSIIGSDEGSIADEVDVQEEAKLLMSLSCSTPSTSNLTTNSSIHNHHHTNATATSSPSTSTSTGRITPSSSDSSSCYSSTSSKRDSFCFTCPSLSLENHSRDVVETSSEQHPPQQQHPKQQEESSSSSSSSQSSLPSVLLGRSLKIDDKDALRLSSEAMGRNILQSYKKALDWRLKSWEHSLSRVLVHKERDLVTSQASEQAMKALLTSGEANLLLALRAMEAKLRVMDATTSFKVLPQRLNKTSDSSSDQPPSKKQRLEEALGAGLEETDYEYQVAHAMMLEACLNIHTPAGYCKIELEVPGSMTGTFLSPASDGAGEELTNVRMDVNTDILAAMIEKSSRTVIRAAAEALLKGEVDVEAEQKEQVAKEETVPTKKGRKSKADKVKKEQVETPQPITATSTPKRKLSEERMQRMVVITPARNAASSPSSFGDSDCEDNKPVLLSLPDSFESSSSSKPKLKMLTPKPSRKKAKKSAGLPTVVTPHKTQRRETITSGAGPILPLLVEVACAMVKK